MTTAKKFVKKLSKVNYTCKNGEIIQTGCKVFGMPILKNGIPDGICSNCVDKENQLTCILQVAKSVVTKAKADWPELLKGAPESMQRAIAERLAGGVALA